MMKSKIRILMTILLLAMAGCIAYLIFHSPVLYKIDLLPRNVEVDTFIELQPGEKWEQSVYVYKSFEQITLFRKQSDTECTVSIEILQGSRPLWSEQVTFVSGAAETELPVIGEKGTLLIRLINQGNETLSLPLIASQYYDIDYLVLAKEPLIQLGITHFSVSVPWTLGIAVLLLCILSLTVLWGWGAEWNHKKAFLFILTICLVYLILFPAWNINDFSAHFATAYSVSSRLLGSLPVDESNRLMVREEDQFYLRYVLTDRCSPYYQPSRRSYDDAAAFLFQRTTQNQIVPTDYALHPLDGYGFWNYIPSILGILLARLLSLNLVTAVFLARLFGIAFYVAGISFALRQMRKNMILSVTILSSFPVCAINLTAISYDALCYVLVLILFACILSLREKNRLTNAITLAVCSAALGMVKGGAYIPFILSIFMLLTGKDQRNRITAIGSILAAFLGLGFNYRHLLFRNIRYFQFGFTGSGSYTPEWALQHPLEYWIMMARTYLRKPDIILDIAGHRLGWNYEVIPEIICVLLFLLLLFSAFSQDLQQKKCRSFSRFEKIWIWFPVTLLILFTPAMMLSSTDIGSETILGVQGRYYLPLLIPICLLLYDCASQKQKIMTQDTSFLLSSLGFLTLMSVYYVALAFSIP